MGKNPTQFCLGQPIKKKNVLYTHFCLGERGEMKCQGERGEMKNQIVAPGSATLAPQELVSIRKNLTKKKKNILYVQFCLGP